MLKYWYRIGMMTDLEGKIPIKNVVKTFASGKTEKLVYSSLAEQGLPSEKGAVLDHEAFTFEKFYNLYESVCPRTDIDELFRKVTKLEFIKMDQMITFMNECQRDDNLNQVLYPMYDERRCMEIINAHEPEKDNINNKRFSKQGLLTFLMSDENAPVFLDRLDVYQDMSFPMCHYLINSSHNTYLSGKQFGGKSTAEMYDQSLLSGCRCVELDCWDGKGADEIPIITHGKAMCTEILAEEAFQSIGICAFITSDYPVILSFENHCCKSQQLKLAQYCQKYFGKDLLDAPIPGHPLKAGSPLPAPEKLKRKILIKNKRLKPELEKAELEIYNAGGALAEEAKEDAGAAPPAPKEEVNPEGGPPKPAAYAGTSLTNIHPWLSSMVNYAQPVHFNGFDVAEEKNIHHNMSSFSESAGLAYLKGQAVEFVNYNKRQMSRIYPKGARVDSSNYMPQIFWNAGCHMVSLNFQTPDLPMQLNGGRFEYNGNCGYLVKPDFMRLNDKTFDPFAEAAVDGVVAKEIEVSIISGQFLSDKKVGTYVEVDMYGLPADTVRKEFRTKVIPSNGLNPQYQDDPFKFRKVVLPDLASIRLGVFDEGGKFLGQRILPLDGLQCGYHHISLRSEGNFPLSLAMLFCQIDIKIYIPDGLGDMMDALCDPRAFMNAQQKRDAQMKAMGIDTADSAGIKLKGGKKKEAGKGKGGKGGKPEKEEIPYKQFDPITVEFLQGQKAFQKANKKQAKDMETMKKKHTKERNDIQKKQCTAIEKASKGKKEVMDDPGIKAIVQEQMKSWTEMVTKHRKEEWTMMREQLKSQEEALKVQLELAQADQFKELEVDFEKRNKEMKAAQAQAAVALAKEIANDKTLKTKADKDRRLKEKQQTNTKNVIQERKDVGIKQGKAKDKLKKQHEKQLASIKDDIAMAIQYYETAEEEMTRRNKMEFFC